MSGAAPEFPGLQWIGSASPPRRTDLEGQVVLLAFWTPSCVHSRQLLRDLAFLEQRFCDRTVAVLSVLGARHPTDRDPEVARRAVQRLQVLHPVAHDPDAAFWKAYGCEAWPTLVVLDAQGALRYQGAGEPKPAALMAAVDALLGEAEAAGRTAPEPLRTEPDRGATGPSGLCFPTRLCVDPGAGLLWVADTGNHRVLGVDLDGGTVRCVAGSGLPGDGDGPLEQAGFWFPSGLAVHGERLLVADTGNHRLRAVHQGSGHVETIAGSGRRGRDTKGGGFGTDQDLHSPLDLCVHDGTVYIAVAGTHQLWAFDPDTLALRAVFGTGAQAQRDGDADQALLSQPAGLAVEAAEILLVDSGGGALRSVDLDHMVVHTLSGGATGGTQSLHFPQAVALYGRDAFVADPARHRVVKVDRSSGAVVELVGKAMGLCAPEGLAVQGDRLWIADTGNHRLVALDPRRPGEGLLDFPLRDLPTAAEPFAGPPRARPEVALAASEGVQVRVRLPLPAAGSTHPDFPVLLRIVDPEGSLLAADVDQAVEMRDGHAFLDWMPLNGPGRGELLVEVRYQTVRDPVAAGHRQVFRRRQPLLLAAEGHHELVID